VNDQELKRISNRRQIPVRLSGELLQASALALVPMEKSGGIPQARGAGRAPTD
jgi:hypothetical protein